MHQGCQSAVADAFFQTGGTTGAVNDLPVASYGSESEDGSVAATGRRDRGWCMEGWHPRGQDASYAIGNSTGRTLFGHFGSVP